MFRISPAFDRLPLQYGDVFFCAQFAAVTTPRVLHDPRIFLAKKHLKHRGFFICFFTAVGSTDSAPWQPMTTGDEMLSIAFASTTLTCSTAYV